MKKFLRKALKWFLILLFTTLLLKNWVAEDVVNDGFPPLNVEETLLISTKDGTGMLPVYNFFMDGEKVECGNASCTYFMIKYTKRYFITYTPSDATIVVLLTDTDLSAMRIAAENILEKRLRVPRETLCKLAIKVTMWSAINGNPGGVDYGLSFCKSGKKFKN